MSYNTKLYFITTQTNIHAGSGKQTYGIIDNLVQRDHASDRPNINGSSLKGALREFFTQKRGKNDDLIQYVFGKESTKNDADNAAGNYRFFDANLLTIPIRSGYRPFFRTLSPDVARHLSEMLSSFGKKLGSEAQSVIDNIIQLDDNNNHFAHHFISQGENESIYLEDYDKLASYQTQFQVNQLEDLVGDPIAVIDDSRFKSLCDDNHLPVVARNSLEDGRSKNLWYEQIVPRQSVFFSLVLVPEGDTYFDNGFNSLLTGNQPIQIGANASIGYGFCQFKEIALQNL